MKKITLLYFLLSISSFVLVSSVQAASINFTPSSQSVNLGDMLTVDIVISGLEEGNLDEIVSAFDLDISFNQNVLAAKDPIFGSFHGDLDPFLLEAVFSSDIDSKPGTIDLAFISFFDDFELAPLQPDSFILATLAFTAIEPGTSALDFVLDQGLDIKGRNAAILDNLTSGTTNINVLGTPTQIPEPPMILLIGISLFILISKKYWKLFSL